MKKSGQNMVEFVFVLPLLIFLLLAVIELALYWREVQVVQETALEVGIVASQTVVHDTDNPNPAITPVTALLNKRMKLIYLNKTPGALTVNTISGGSYGGTPPYAIYEFLIPSGCDTTADGSCKFWARMDYRDPFKKGVITQTYYNYDALFFGIQFNLPYQGKMKKVVIIPKNIGISSTKIQQYVHY